MKCKDYYIVKLRTYADESLLKKCRGDNDPLPAQHHQRAKQYVKFLWEFIEYLTGTPSSDFHLRYFMSSRDCALEQIAEDFGIIFSDGEGWNTIFIPKTNDMAYNYVIDNCGLPYKVVKKTSIDYLKHRPVDMYRKISKKYEHSRQ